LHYVAYADDGYIKATLSVDLQVLAELKHVLKEDAGLDLNISKTSVLPKGVTQQAAFDVAHSFIDNNPVLTPLMWMSPSRHSVLKVSLVLVCLLVLMILYGTLYLKHVGLS
jgi:hypothetical protein